MKEVELVRLDLNESANKIKQEQAVLKGKTDREVTDLMITIEDQDRQLNDLQKQLRKQAKQVSVSAKKGKKNKKEKPIDHHRIFIFKFLYRIYRLNCKHHNDNIKMLMNNWDNHRNVV